MTIPIRHPRIPQQVRNVMLAALVVASAAVTVHVTRQAVTDSNNGASSPSPTVSRVDNTGLGQALGVEGIAEASVAQDVLPDSSVADIEAQLAAFDASVLIPSMVGLSAQGFIPDWSLPGLETQLATFDASVLIPSMVGLSAQGFIPGWSIPDSLHGATS